MSRLPDVSRFVPEDAAARWLNAYAALIHASVELDYETRKRMRREYRRAKAILVAVLKHCDGQRIVTKAGVVTLRFDPDANVSYPAIIPNEARATAVAA